MTKLEPKINCRFCKQVFELFEDLQKHDSQHNWHDKQFKYWIEEQEAKIKSFESVVQEDLTPKPIREIIE